MADKNKDLEIGDNAIGGEKLDEFLIKEQEFRDELEKSGYRIVYSKDENELWTANILDSDENVISNSSPFMYDDAGFDYVGSYMDGFRDNFLKPEILDLKVEDFFSPSGRDILNNLNLSPEMRTQVDTILAEAVPGTISTDIQLDLVNLGNRVNPSLFILNKDIELGYINIKDNFIDYNINGDMIASMEVKKEMNDIIKDELGEDVAKIVEAADKEITPALEEKEAELKKEFDKIPEPEKADAKQIDPKQMDKEAKDITSATNAKDIYKEINGEMVKVPKFILKEQAKAERADKINEFKQNAKDKVNEVKEDVKAAKEAVENSKIKQLYNQRAETRNNYKGALNNLIGAQNALNNALAEARMNGFDKKTEQTIEKCKNKVSKATKEAINARNNYKEFFKNEISKETVKIKAALTEKINGGINCLRRIGKDIELANHQFGMGVKTAYAGLEIKAMQNNMAFYAKAYAADKAVLNSLEKEREKTLERFNKRNTIINAVKNVGRAVIGKEMTNEVALTENQQKKLKEIDLAIDKTKYSCDISKGEFANIEKEIQEKFVDITCQRQSAGLKESRSFMDKVLEAKKRSDEMKKSMNKVDSKTSKEKDNDAR